MPSTASLTFMSEAQRFVCLVLVRADPVVQVQDEAAGLVVALLDPQPGESILDACAAPGGKALYAASRMHNQVRCCILFQESLQSKDMRCL